MSDPRLLVVGLGYLGSAVAELARSHGWQVTGTARTAENKEAGFEVASLDITDREQVLRFFHERPPFDWTLCSVSTRGGTPGDYERIYLGGCRNLVEAGARLLLVGSTSVYGQTGGEWVTESSPTEPAAATGEVLLQTESVVLSHGGSVARMAGLYGPERSVLIRKFLDGSARIEAGGQRWINQAHRDDAAAAMVHLMQQEAPAGIYNLSDGTPMTQLAIYQFLAEHFQQPLPPEGPATSGKRRGRSNKRVSNAALKATGWQPRYPDFPSAVRQQAAG